MPTKLTCINSTIEAVFTTGNDYQFGHITQTVKSNGGYAYQVVGRNDGVIIHDSSYGHFEFVEAE